MSRPAPAAIDECWRLIGVDGDRSCPELVKAIHCRSCPVFAEQAARLLERPVSAEDTEGWGEALAAPRAVGEEGSESALVFGLGGEWLGLPTRSAAFVASEVAVRRLPGRSGKIFSGLCVVLGEMTLAVSLRGLLGVGPARGRSGVRWVAMGEPAERWVFDVDELLGVIRFAPAALEAAPTEPMSSVVSYLSGVIRAGERDVGLLDPQRLDQAFLRSLEA